MVRSFTKKEEGENSMEVLFWRQNLETKTRFFFIEETQRTWFNLKALEGEERVLESVWVIERPMPSPIRMSLGLS